MLIGQLCKEAGVSRELVRHYESMGLLVTTPRVAGSRTYREFSADSPNRIRIIKQAQAIGFTLKEVEPLLNAFMSQDLTRAEALSVLDEKLERIERIIQDALEAKATLLSQIETIRAKDGSGCLK